MSETHITLYDKDSEMFEQVRSDLHEKRGGEGSPPNNPEVIRRLVEASDL